MSLQTYPNNSQSPRILLIPGYGTGVTYTPWRRRVDPYRGFKAFAHQANVEIFTWGSEARYSLSQSLNPLTPYFLYYQEKQLLEDAVLQARLRTTLHSFRPEIVIAHSLGSVLFLKTALLPSAGLRRLVFVNSDLRLTAQVITVLQTFKDNGVELFNVHCFWDQALLVSSLLSFSQPLGLGPNPLFKNFFLPLFGAPNLHESSLASTRLVKIALN